MLKNDYLLAKIGADTAENESFESGMIPKISGLFALCLVPPAVGNPPGSTEGRRRGLERHLEQRLPPRGTCFRLGITLSEARSRLYQRRFWPPNSHFAAFFKIYKICILLHQSVLNFLEKIVQNVQKFANIFKILIYFLKFSLKSRNVSRNFAKF